MSQGSRTDTPIPLPFIVACKPATRRLAQISGPPFPTLQTKRRMAQTAAHLVECVIPWVPTRQWVVSVPMPLRYWMATARDLMAQVHTIIRTTLARYDVNQAVKRR
jgi:hypothetical protein